MESRAQRASFVIALSLIALALLLLRWTLRVDSLSATPVLLTPSAANAKASKASIDSTASVLRTRPGSASQRRSCTRTDKKSGEAHVMSLSGSRRSRRCSVRRGNWPSPLSSTAGCFWMTTSSIRHTGFTSRLFCWMTGRAEAR